MRNLGDIKIGRVGQYVPNYISIRCDRKTPLGNPFYMANESQRNDVCDKFETYLPTVYKPSSAVASQINGIVATVTSGNNVLLQCWCAPKRCHCDSIKNFVLKLINNTNNRNSSPI